MTPLDEIQARADGGRVCQQAECDRRDCHAVKDRASLLGVVRAVEEVAQRLDMLSGHTYGYWARQIRAAVAETLEPTP